MDVEKIVHTVEDATKRKRLPMQGVVGMKLVDSAKQNAKNGVRVPAKSIVLESEQIEERAHDRLLSTLKN
jgi:hypothetical protein